MLDTKWKRIDQSLNNAREKFGLSQADFYQLLAYGERYMGGVGDHREVGLFGDRELFRLGQFEGADHVGFGAAGVLGG